MTTYIHPDNPFFGGMEQVVLALIIFYLVVMFAILIAIAFVIKVVFTAIFNRNSEEHVENNTIETEETSDEGVVDNSTQSSKE